MDTSSECFYGFRLHTSGMLRHLQACLLELRVLRSYAPPKSDRLREVVRTASACNMNNLERVPQFLLVLSPVEAR